MKHIPFILSIFLICAAVLSVAGENNKGELPDAVVEGEEVIQLDSQKPKLELVLDPDKELTDGLKLDDNIYINKTTIWEKAPYHFVVKKEKSRQIISPAQHHIRNNYVHLLYPYAMLGGSQDALKRKKTKKQGRWELVVADDLGQTFRTYTGQGLPPEIILFDGRDNNGKIMQVGRSYSSILKYHDANNNLRTFSGNSFSVMGLSHQENSGFHISIDFNKLYQNPPTALRKSQFSELGQELLEEAANIIKEHYFTARFQIIVHSKDIKVANTSSKQIAQKLSKLLIKPLESISTKGKKSTSSLESVKIVIQ